MLNQFENLSCYEEFEIQSALTGISKIDILREIGYKIDNYYFFISNDGIFNWYDLNGNYVENPGILKTLKEEYISQNITKCVIPDGVTCIDKEVFWDRNSLKEIIIPSSLTSIGGRAFSNCYSLKEINIPNSVTYIGDEAFKYCTSLTSITIPNSVTRIGYSVFYGCISLKEITIPDSVKNIGNYVFLFCESLKEIIFKGKTLEEVKRMKNYPFGIEDENIFKCKI